MLYFGGWGFCNDQSSNNCISCSRKAWDKNWQRNSKPYACVWCLATQHAQVWQRKCALIRTRDPNKKSEPNNWHIETLQYVLSSFELFLALFLLYYVIRWTDLFAFLFSESQAISYVQHSTPPSIYIKKLQPCCPPRSTSPRTVALGVLHVSVTPEFLSIMERKLTSQCDLSVSDYIHLYILRIDPSFRALCWWA